MTGKINKKMVIINKRKNDGEDRQNGINNKIEYAVTPNYYYP